MQGKATMRHRSKWATVGLIALGVSACSSSGDAAAEAPVSVLSTEQQTSGQPRPGDGGLIRTVDMTVGGVAITAEIADTPALRERGLMGRESLPENHGMLFVYADEQIRSFWMRNTPITLDIAFLDGNGSIVNVATMQPNSDDSTLSESPAMYALEMTAGWFEKNDIQAGARVQF
ncbi:MAG: DUF192 domain-containing protein [Gemmatimonadales bacterium]|nr:MAG: DUF192 domain-containing protein [Gemmatimonadales bacterium]